MNRKLINVTWTSIIGYVEDAMTYLEKRLTVEFEAVGTRIFHQLVRTLFIGGKNSIELDIVELGCDCARS